MRIALATAVSAALLLSACGGSDDAGDPIDDTIPTDSATDEGPADEPDGGATTAPGATIDGASAKPTVEIPSDVPTELVRTVLVEGSGPEATDGDQVIVDYVGVRSVDGVEFDNSYERGEPFAVSMGEPGVIQGWQDGLAGAQAGQRLQLDIPSDLAYGDTARGEVIRENEALTFVIDVRAVVRPQDPADAPDEPGVELSTEPAADTEVTDLVAGDGATLETGRNAIIQYVMFRGDNGAVIESNWTGRPLELQVSDSMLPGLAKGLPGMQVGGRRAIVIPPDDGFGPDGNPQGGLPAGTNMIIVVDLLATY